MLIRYYLLRLFLLPFAFLPHAITVCIGRFLGNLCYLCLSQWRKRAFSNLSLAKDLELSPPEIRKIARRSFQNLAITVLEYPLFARTKQLERYVRCQNPETAEALIKDGKGIVFFVGHQANWELLFLEGTRRMPGVAIGRPTKNTYLYNWVCSIRERFGGAIVEPRKGIGKGLKALKSGKFMGIVGDQGLPGGHRGEFLGCPCWTSPAPALLAQKTGSPIMVASIRRIKRRYEIVYSDPIWPEGKTVDALMDETLLVFEKSVKACPEQWLWQHNRFKQEDSSRVFYRYRHDTILVLLPEDDSEKEEALILKKIYPDAFLTMQPDLKDVPPYYYKFLIDLRKEGGKRMRALRVLKRSELEPNLNLKEALIKKLCRQTASI